MTTRFLSTLAVLAASVTLGANLISAGSAQAAIFDFNAVWADNTTTKGWIEVDDTKADHYSQDDPYSFDSRYWQLGSLLDADFTHEGTRYDKSDITSLGLNSYIFPESSYYQTVYGDLYTYLDLWFKDQYVFLSVEGNTHSSHGYGEKYNDSNPYGELANSVSLVERSAEAVPEPTTMAGLALVGLGIAGTRRKQIKASVKV